MYFYAVFRQLLCESGQFEWWTFTRRRRELADMMGRLECCECRRLMEGEQSDIVGEEAASCSLVVQTSKSGMEWDSAVQRTEV